MSPVGCGDTGQLNSTAECHRVSLCGWVVLCCAVLGTLPVYPRRLPCAWLQRLHDGSSDSTLVLADLRGKLFKRAAAAEELVRAGPVCHQTRGDTQLG